MDMYSDSKNGKISIRATNIKEFKKLIEKAKVQSDELKKTVDELNYFNLEVSFSTEDAIDSQSQ